MHSHFLHRLLNLNHQLVFDRDAARQADSCRVQKYYKKLVHLNFLRRCLWNLNEICLLQVLCQSSVWTSGSLAADWSTICSLMNLSLCQLPYPSGIVQQASIVLRRLDVLVIILLSGQHLSEFRSFHRRKLYLK